MTGKHWQRVEDIFQTAADLAGAEREAWMAKACGDDASLLAEVRALLDSDAEAHAFVEKQFASGVLAFEATESTRFIRRAGPYTLTRELGRGGMGIVYLGERSDGQYDGEVAVKLVSRGMDTDFFLARFKRERQALARLGHPNIARLLDSGTTEDGSPYIVMERVEGRPINVYCREENLGVTAILRLYLDVCRAVSHAHRNFIVHRDLKPGNIMVEAGGHPKLLDFGICKLLMSGPQIGEMTATSQMMTPDYASPEQVRGDPITIASDIYSLGAVLYELLTGRRPHAIEKYTPQNVAKAVCDQESLRPSEAAADRRRARELAGDLDTILLKALQKDPARRYESVDQFAEDLRRTLHNEPVLARPDTAAYRVRKFTQRHTAAVAAALIVTVAMTGGMIAYARQAAVARRESAEGRKLANAMMFDIHDRMRNLPGSLAAREAIVRAGLVYLDRLAAEGSAKPALQRDLAAAYLRIGQVQGSVLESNTGDTAGALASFQKGLAAIASLPESKETGVLRIDLHRAMGQVLNTRSNEEALRNIEQAVAIGTRLHQQHPGDDEITRRLAGLYESNALSLRLGEHRVQALELSVRAGDLYRELLGRHPEDREIRADLAGALSNLGAIQANQSQTQEARTILGEAVAQLEELCRLEPANNAYQRSRMLAYSHLGDLLGNPNYANLGDTEGAIAAFRSMIAVAENRYRKNPGDQGAAVDYAMSLARTAAIPLGSAQDRLSMYGRAAGLLEAAMQKDPANGNTPMQLAAQKEEAGDLLMTIGRQPEAAESYRTSLHIVETMATKPPAAYRIAVTVSQKTAEAAARRGDSARALAFANRAVAVGERIRPDSPVPLRIIRPRSYAAMGSVQAMLNHPLEALRWRERALEEYRKLDGQPGFTPAHRGLMKAVEAAIEKQKKENGR